MNWRSCATLMRADYRETLAACDGQADLVLTSPPYCDARTYGAAVSWGDEDYAALGEAVFGALRPGGHALVNVDAPVREWRKGMGTERGFHPWRLMLDWAERVGFRVPDRLAFGRMGSPGKYGGRFRNDWEPLLWFIKPGGQIWMDRKAIAAPAKWGTMRGVVSVRRHDGTHCGRNVSGWAAEAGMTHRGTFWDYGHVGADQTGAPDIEAQNHPARWPYKLAEDIVRCFCPPDGLACDPFLGAGTSLVAAIEHGRRFIGGDLYARQDDGVAWIDVAAAVMDARARQLKLFEVGSVGGGQSSRAPTGARNG
jgi:DNA modification methylase